MLFPLYRKALGWALCLALLMGAASLASAQDIVLNGAGSTFVAPAMVRWTQEYQKAHPNIKINYQPLGSGAGIGMFTVGTVDFGATDAPMTDQQIAGTQRKPIHIPVIAGAVVLGYNLPGIREGLRLSGDIIADIYLGKITRWNDTRIAKDNPTLPLPDLAITVCRRYDGSGTTFIFTDYLSSVSAEWKSKIGKGRQVHWPVGVPGKGNGGVADAVKARSGGIGYVELASALKRKMTFGPVRNQKGRYITASTASASAALDETAMKNDVRVSLVNAAGENAYPICGVTYLLIPQSPSDATKSRATEDFLRWILGPGQSIAEALSYAPLPKSVIALNLQTLSRSGSASAK